ncbi:chloroplast SRP receptor [Klebsormidium nitens]|uniref:Chloroplast SRP receptor n=1 Tax=Klebsormidium nitens TaxID=105231 RepID=A0A0U9I6U4_KLENI|nr:chloroplast SRP receptor [Klebsormidium nitens]|eukprot:GAQ81018.1 chloroplast SRP receptor [Klebsormidium nitens]
MAQSALLKTSSIAGIVRDSNHLSQLESTASFSPLSSKLPFQHGESFLGNGTELRHCKPVKKLVEAPERATGVCRAEGGFLGRIGRVIQEKAKSDIDRLLSGTEKTRQNLKVVDELLTYWKLEESENILEELEEALLVADFGPRTSLKIIDAIRKDILAGEIKTGEEIKTRLKESIVRLLTKKAGSSELRFAAQAPTVIMVAGVNGGGKTTTIGKLTHRLKNEGKTVMMAAGDTFRAAAVEQLEKWAERTGAEFVKGAGVKSRPSAVLGLALTQARSKANAVDVLICDTSGRLHTNTNLMDELKACKRALAKQMPDAPHEVLLVLDGTTGLNMLPQAREFNEYVGITGFVLTKLDGTSRGGCVVSVVDELGIPVKFVGVGEALEDLQPFDADAYVEALFPRI